MVVQVVNDIPMDVSSSKQSKKYVVVKNHVRELLPKVENTVLDSSDSKAVDKSNTVDRKHLKRKKKSQTQSLLGSDHTEISKSDLAELRTVHRNCVDVLQKIESKYGHLLNLEVNDRVESYTTSIDEEPSCDYCSCSQKKKIVFDDNGHQIEKDCVENHICVKRIKKAPVEPKTPSIQLQYDNVLNLPNDLQELKNILTDTNIDKSYRKMVIDKVYLVRQEYLSEIRFDKQNIIKQLKEDPDKLFDFKGSNLSSLHGYPT